MVAQMVKRLPTMWETCVRSLGWEDPLEKEMATHSSTLAWKIPQIEQPGGLQSMGSQRAIHDWAMSLNTDKMLSGGEGIEQAGLVQSIKVFQIPTKEQIWCQLSDSVQYSHPVPPQSFTYHFELPFRTFSSMWSQKLRENQDPLPQILKHHLDCYSLLRHLQWLPLAFKGRWGLSHTVARRSMWCLSTRVNLLEWEGWESSYLTESVREEEWEWE